MTIYGADISYWQGQIDFSVLSRKVQYLFIRACHGRGVDPTLARNVEQATEYGIPYGLYIYVTPGYPWRDQADLFTRLIEQYGSPLYPVIDLEDQNSGLNKVELESWVFKFQRQVGQATGKTLMIYTNAGYFNRYMPLTDWAWRMPLWVAHWDVPKPLLPYEWSNHKQEWTIWQYSAKGNELGHEYGCPGSWDIDLDQFQGGVEEFEKAFGVPPGVIEPLPPPVTPDWVVVTGDAVNVRNAPEITAASQVGKWRKGGRLDVVAEIGDWYEVKCYIHKDLAVKAQ